MAVEITSLKRLTAPIVAPSGSTILAYLSARDGDIELVGLTLVRKPDGRLALWPPQLEDRSRSERRAANRAVILRRGGDMERRFLEAGIAAFEALGGIPDSEPEPDLPKIPALASAWT